MTVPADETRIDEAAKNELAREIIKHICNATIELAFIRHELVGEAFDADDYPDAKSSVAAQEQFMEEIKVDTLNCLTGDDFGCLDEEDLNESNCELIWLDNQLASSRAEVERLRAELGQVAMFLLQNNFEEARERALLTQIDFTDGSPHAALAGGK